MPRSLRNGEDRTTVDIEERVAAGLIKKVRQRLQPDAVPSLEVVSHFRIGDLSQRHQLVGGSTSWAGLQVVGVQKLADNRDTIEFHRVCGGAMELLAGDIDFMSVPLRKPPQHRRRIRDAEPFVLGNLKEPARRERFEPTSSSQSYSALNRQNNSGQALRLPAGAQHLRGLGVVWNSTGGEVGIHRRC